jgi:hypothetical protein
MWPRYLALAISMTTSIACGGAQSGSDSRQPADFCNAVSEGDLAGASASVHTALVERAAEGTQDASEPLATWLRAQPCVTRVDVPPEVIDTEPAIREIAFELTPDSAGVVRRCDADLRLAPGAAVRIHPTSVSTNDADRRCTRVR